MTAGMRSRAILLFVGLCVGCGGSATGAGAGSTSGGETAGSGTGSPTGGEVLDHGDCEHYLACIAATTPAALPGAAMGFGEDGTCWQGGAAEAMLCRDACKNGLAQTKELFPDAVECRDCGADADCAADERCNRGDCVADGVYCGNGRVEDGESCDRSPGCSAACDGAPCAPLTGDGCKGDQACMATTGNIECSLDHGTSQVGGPCVFLSACAPGLTCIEHEDCPDGSCCAALCDRYGETPCPGGNSCVGYTKATGRTTPEIFDYLGVCL